MRMLIYCDWYNGQVELLVWVGRVPSLIEANVKVVSYNSSSGTTDCFHI